MTVAPGPASAGAAGDRRETGSATVLALAAAGCLVIALAAGLVLASAVAARHQATSAADLGALAGAGALAEGATPLQACAEAARIAADNAGTLTRCSTGLDESVVVAVEVPVAGLLSRAGWRRAHAEARAGPAASRAPP